MLLVAICCFWGPAIVDIPFVPGDSIVVGVPCCWLPCCGWHPANFSTHAIVDVSAVAGALMLLAFRLFLAFLPLLASLLFLASLL
jgi:hypothetical protein